MWEIEYISIHYSNGCYASAKLACLNINWQEVISDVNFQFLVINYRNGSYKIITSKTVPMPINMNKTKYKYEATI